MYALQFEDVSISYRTRDSDGAPLDYAAVKHVNLTLPRKGTLGIAGESGSGKSTLIMSALRLLPDSATVSGSIRVGDHDMNELSWGQVRAVRWNEASIIFQGAMHSLNPVQRVGRQIAEAIRLHDPNARRSGRDDYRPQVLALLEQVDLLPHTINAYPHELSGGQKQRVMIAMALACDPDIIIADEPTTALDVIVQERVLDLLTKLVKERGLSLLMITHDLSVLARTCDEIAVMYQGEIVETGPSREILANPRHPHTRALTDAVPVIGDPKSRLNPASRKQSAPGETTALPVIASGVGAEILSTDDLTVSFHTRVGNVTAVDGVDLSCREGEITVLVGQSGSGKTTLVRTVLGLQPPSSGAVRYRGQPLSRRARDLRDYRGSVQFVLQDPMSALNPKHTVYEIIAEGIRIQGFGGDERERVRQALLAAELYPPERFFTKLPKELSGGQRQRVVIAGALALEPDFLIADEPVASLDASVRGEILALLLRLKRDLGLGCFVITHDLGVAWNIADRVLVMHRGKIVEAGNAEDVLLSPQHDYTRQLLAAVPTMGAPEASERSGA
ncbi:MULTISPECIES: ABC transporter ATP-binding protein [unclassified Leucobacter]|uniref:ATP-binding cassette domain-containing protein n=1 Tax=unclassified Leucobacter TaxID=2621730 RepID=UPI00165DCBDA|nr:MULTISPECIES: ABC transporter ATP-binding protein [unclassified Leucobacter]MBC9936117.1 ABC transporter ATP-binding protein [Leucobacter sp. cx-87]